MTQIYIALLDEAVNVWRPVSAKHIKDNIYQIIDQNNDYSVETWQFNYGETVMCEMKDVSEGRILAAVRKVEAR